MVNNCLFLENVAVTANARFEGFGGGAIATARGNLNVFNSIFKKNKAIQANTAFGGGGAIYTSSTDVLVLSSVFELNEATNNGGAALLFFLRRAGSVDWYNNKELLFGNDAGVFCDGVADFIAGRPAACSSVGENFSL